MRISDWSSDVCSSDLAVGRLRVSRTGNTPPSDRSQGAALALGARIDGSLVNAEETDLYSFTLAGPARVAFDSLTNDAGKAWTLTGPRGLELSNRALDGKHGVVGKSVSVRVILCGCRY